MTYRKHTPTTAKQTHRAGLGVPGLFLGIGIGLAAWLLLLLLAALVLVKMSDPMPLVLPAALIAAALGAFVSGVCAAVLSGFRMPLSGGTAALVMTACVLVLSGISPRDAELSALMRVCVIAILVSFSLFGAFAAENKGKRRAGHRRTRK